MITAPYAPKIAMQNIQKMKNGFMPIRKKVRKVQNITCPNDQDCAEALGKIRTARETIRRIYWIVNEAKGPVRERRQRLLDDFDSMKALDQQSPKFEIQFQIDGIFVCKSFFG